MKSIFITVILLSLGTLVDASETILEHNQGVVSIPPEFTYDAHPGGSLRPKDARNGIIQKGTLRIDFESGETCGRAVEVMADYWTKGKTATILQRREARLSGQAVLMLIVKSHLDPKGRRSAIVSYPESKIDFTCDFEDEGQLADFLFVAFSYKPNQKPAEAGTGQPATRPELKSEGSDKLQPEAEGRSR